MPDAVTTALARGLPAVSGVSETDRAERMREIRAELLQTERREEALVMIAQQHGVDCSRRPMADPCAVLGVRVVKAAKAAA